MKRELTPELIRRYLNGDCTPAEATEVREWYDSFENHTDPLAFLSPRERETLKRRMYDEIMLCLQTKGALSDEESSVHAGDEDRKSVEEGKSVSVRIDLGGRRIIKKKKTVII